MRKMSYKPVGGDVLGDPFRININAASYYIVQTHIPVPLPPLGKAWFMRKLSHKPVGVDVLGDPFWMNINAASYYIVQTHIRVPLAFSAGEGLISPSS